MPEPDMIGPDLNTLLESVACARDHLDPDHRQACDAARAKLVDVDGHPTPRYQAYMRFQDEYHTKLRAWQEGYAQASADPMKLQAWPLEGGSYHHDADAALTRWETLGFKQEIDAAIAVLKGQASPDHGARAR
jgi:hypothetical protein